MSRRCQARRRRRKKEVRAPLAEHASGIVDTVAKIAKTIGIPLLHAAPYIAALI
jgi:hypothetical protein